MVLSMFFIANGQGKVQSAAYNLMLKTLLSHSVNEISVDSVDTAQDLIFLDTREKEEYDVSHIKDAIWVGYDDFKNPRVSGIDKDSKIIVYCSVGYRSEKVAEKLNQEGFSDVSNLYGGIFEWKNQRFPVYNGEEETQNVHAYSKTWGIWLNNGNKVYEK